MGVTGEAAAAAVRDLVLFGDVLADPVGQALSRWLGCRARTGAAEDPDAARGRRREERRARREEQAARDTFAALAEATELSHRPLVGTPWQSHLLARLLDAENAFTLKAQSQPYESLGPGLRQAAAADLARLGTLARLDLESLPGAPAGGLSFNGLAPSEPLEPEDPPTRELKERLLRATDWQSEAAALAGYFHANGAGLFRRYRAFRWVVEGGGGRLVGLEQPDPIRLENLIGYDAERELLLRNTEFFVAGLPANNVLVYGERGTGKSSTIKALLHAYGDRGLRIVEVPKSRLVDFSEILRALRHRRERFILFIDDLSFEEEETTYKELKAVLEGGLEARPDNVLLYATSNRRHLVRERFSDRHTPLTDDEVRVSDTVEEKLSLSDRFGITLVFYAPDQKRYLRIVRGLAEQRGVDLPAEELEARAIAWTQQHNERSGRTARQFIDFLAADLALSRPQG